LGGFAPDLALLPPHGYAGGFVSPPPPPGAFMAGLQAQLQAVPAQRGTGSMSTQASRGLRRGLGGPCKQQ
jgi:hypothetical protein